MGEILRETGTTRLPGRVRIVEVGPRDGLQNERQTVPTAGKVEFIRLLARAGLSDIEATSFVRSDRVPQLADAGDLMSALADLAVHSSLPRLWALVPNMRGLDRAIDAGLSAIAALTAASDTFNRKNVNMSTRESVEAVAAIAHRAQRQGIAVRVYVSTCWMCPYEGAIRPEVVAGLVRELFALGVDEVSVGDTSGAATPPDVGRTLAQVFETSPVGRTAVHFHDTYGMAMANAWEALQAGVTIFDSSAGGLGGCPYAPGATGNVATEDLLYLFDRLGIETGVRLSALGEASRYIGGILERALPSRVLAAITSKGPAAVRE